MSWHFHARVKSVKSRKHRWVTEWVWEVIENGYFTYIRMSYDHKRLTPPLKGGPLRSSFCEFFCLCVFYLGLWFYVFWNGFYTRKVIFIQLQEFPTPPYCRCCSVTKRSDSGIAEALKALKMHFCDPSQWDKMCFEYHRDIFQKMGQNYHFCLRSGQRELTPLPPLTISLTVKYPGFF